MPENPRAARELIYQPSLWAARESFVYQYKSALASAELKISFNKNDLKTARVTADVSVKLPLRKSFRFEAESVVYEPNSSDDASAFIVYREADLAQNREKSIRWLGDAFELSSKTAQKNEMAIRLELPTKAVAVFDPLSLLCGLRGYMHPTAQTPAEFMIIASRRFYSANLSRSHKLSGSTNSYALNVIVSHPDQSNKTTKVKDLRELTFDWNDEADMPGSLRVTLPLVGAIQAKLIKFEKSRS